MSVKAADVALPPLPVTFDKLGEAFAGAAVVQREAGLALLLHAEAGWLHLGEGEAEVLVQVVQLVDEVAHITPQHLHQDTRAQQLWSSNTTANTASCWQVDKVQTNEKYPIEPWRNLLLKRKSKLLL